MTMMFVEGNAIEAFAIPLDTTGAAVAGDWYNMKHYGTAVFIIQQGAWAGGTPAVTLEQATSAAGAGAKALAFTKRFTKVAITGAGLVETAVVSNTFNLPNTPNTMNVLEVNAEELDTEGGFTYVHVAIASPGAFGDLIAGIAILSQPRYSGAPGTQLPDPKV